MRRYDAVFFDGYGTLFAGAMEKLIDVCAAVVEGEKLDMDAQAFLEAWDHYFFPMVRREPFVTLTEAQALSLEQVFSDLGVDAQPEPYIRPLIEIFGTAGLFDDVKPSLAALDGAATGIISNADAVHMDAALARNGLDFPVVVTSESARCYKPNPGIFEEALSQMRCTPDRALYVGDSQEDDIVGATRMGMDIAWLNRTGDRRTDGIPEPTYEIESLVEIPGLAGT